MAGRKQKEDATNHPTSLDTDVADVQPPGRRRCEAAAVGRCGHQADATLPRASVMWMAPSSLRLVIGQRLAAKTLSMAVL